jgi:hypothetical protein
MHLPKITAVSHVNDFMIKVTFGGGQSSIIDMRDWVFSDDSAPYLPLRDMAVFSKPCVEEYGWGIVWDDDIEAGSHQLWQLAQEQNALRYASIDFRGWLDRVGLSLTKAAEVFDMSRRMITAYSSGAKPIPKTVLLAMKGYEAEQKGLL